MVTSRAVVGSSAMSSLGLHTRAMAMRARWSIPPENSWGYWSYRFSALAMPTFFITPREISLDFFLSLVMCRRVASLIWLPIVYMGEKATMGSWKIMDICLPRTERISSPRGFSFRRSVRPKPSASKIISPSAEHFLSLMPRMALLVRLLPQPDSPTSPRVSPFLISKSTPRTAVRMPSSVLMLTFRSFT